MADLLIPAPALGVLPTASSNSKVLRERPIGEMEPATWYLPCIEQEGSQGTSIPDLAPKQQVRLRSLDSKVNTSIVFVNESNRPVRTIWLDFKGHEVEYSTVPPEQSKRYRTYATHPWILRDAESGTRMMVGDRQVVHGIAQEQVIKIKCAPMLPWTVKSHRHFPCEFRECVKTLLTSHWAYRKRQAAIHPSLTISCMDRASTSVSSPASPSFLAPCGARGHAATSPSTHAADGGKGALNTSRTSPTTTSGSLSRGTTSLMKLIAGSCRWLPASSTDTQLSGSQGDSPASSSRASPFFALKTMSPWALAPGAALPFPASSPKTQLSLGPFLAELPHDLFLSIVSFMAPTDQLQDVAKYPHGAPDIAPALLPSDPATWEQLVVVPVIIAEVEMAV